MVCRARDSGKAARPWLVRLVSMFSRPLLIFQALFRRDFDMLRIAEAALDA